MFRNRFNIHNCAIFFLIILSFWLRGILFLDPDFGWHFQMGNLIRVDGIPFVDPFSYTMSSFPFIDHEWLTNVIISIIYPLLGQVGLSFIMASFAFLALFILIRKHWEKWTLPFFVLASGALLDLTGIRPQVITWLLFSIVISIILNKDIYKKWGFLLPILIILWVNLHGGFAVGVFTIFFAIILKSIEEKKIDFQNILILTFSVLATFINPYGPQIWREIWMQMSDSQLKWSIMEWIPTLFIPNLAIWTFIPFSLFFVIRYKNKFSLTNIGLYFLILMLGLSSVRHIPLFILIALPITNKSIYYFTQEIKKIKYGFERFKIVNKILLIAFVAIFIVQSILSIKQAIFYSEINYYPYKAIDFLNKHPSNGQIFSQYEWGGYLIWKLPKKKVFIDGRMPSWRWNYNSISESNNAFADYINFFNNRKIPLKYLINKYKVDTILLPKEKIDNDNKVIERFKKLFSFLYVEKKFSQKDIEEEIKEASFIEIYKDDISVIYRIKDKM